MVNCGKLFEQQFKKSVPDDVFYLRLKDGTGNWEHNGLVRFQAQNPCDAIIYDGEILLMVELKNHKGKSIPLDCIRKNQINELSMYHTYKNVKSCVIINFSDLEECYCLFISQITDFIRKGDRKSIPVQYCRENGVKVEMKRLVTNYKYNVKKLLEEVKR